MRYLYILLLSFTLLGCQSAYFKAMDLAGVHKRDIMTDRVEEASEAQQEASEEFKSALEKLQSLTNFDGGDLQDAYDSIENHYEDSEKAVNKVKEKIDEIEEVASALFNEWEDELKLYSNSSLKRDSEMKLRSTRSSYEQMLSAMIKAESKMSPVLDTLRDNTLYLKHNLNAAAIGALRNEFADLKIDIERAIREMNIAIEESNRFILTLNK